METLILVVLIVCNAVFALSEMALLASKSQRLEAMAEAGHAKAKLALELKKEPNRIIAASQIGLTFATLISGAYAEDQYAQLLYKTMQPHFPSAASLQTVCSLTVILAVTALSIVFSEMIPKRAAIANSETIACAMAPAAKRFIALLSPFIWLLSRSAEIFAAATGIRLAQESALSAEDVENSIKAAAKSGILNRTEHQLIDNVWRLDEQKVGAIMIPKQDICWIDITALPENILQSIGDKSAHTWLAAKKSMDNPAGFISASNLLLYLANPKKTDLAACAEPLFGLPNTLTVIEAMEALSANKSKSALVYNEFGQLEGLIGLQDLFCAIVGQTPLDSETPQLLFKDDSGKWLADGLCPIKDLKAALAIEAFPDEDQGFYQTAAGLALHEIAKKHKRMPKEFDFFETQGWKFQIVDIDRDKGYRIDQLMAEPIPDKSVSLPSAPPQA